MSEVGTVLWAWSLYLWSLVAGVRIELNCRTLSWRSILDMERSHRFGVISVMNKNNWLLSPSVLSATLSTSLLESASNLAIQLSPECLHIAVLTSPYLFLGLTTPSLLPSQHPQRAFYIKNLMKLLVLETNSVVSPLWKVDWQHLFQVNIDLCCGRTFLSSLLHRSVAPTSWSRG